jgi:hypothetical protein
MTHKHSFLADMDAAEAAIEKARFFYGVQEQERTIIPVYERCPVCADAGVFERRCTIADAHLAHMARTGTKPGDYAPGAHWQAAVHSVTHASYSGNLAVVHDDDDLRFAYYVNGREVTKAEFDTFNEVVFAFEKAPLSNVKPPLPRWIK